MTEIKPKLRLYDMDGTLSNDEHRRPLYVEKNWSEYWNKDLILADPIYPEALRQLRSQEAEGDIIGILTARLDQFNRETTETWLQDKHIVLDPTYIFLRPDMFSWMRPPQYKSAVVKFLVATEEFSEVTLYDNDAEVVAAVRAEVPAARVVHTTWDVRE